MCQYCHYRDFFLTSVFLFALVGLKIAMDGNPIARKGSKFPGLKKFHRSQLIQNSNWKLHPLQICIASQFLNLHHWQPNLTAAAYIYGYIHFDKKCSVWILLTEYHEYRQEYHSYALLPKRVTKWSNNRLCTREWQEQALCVSFAPFWFFFFSFASR